ncbi:MAG: tRNA (guanosine(37)-N1)-methyltransferase TrmD [Desulfobacterales bacterium]
MKFIALTIFPEMFDCFFQYGIIRKAIEEKKISASTVNIRDYATDKHRTTDDRPYGGGCGMVMKPEPLAGALEQAEAIAKGARRILLTPQGRKFDQHMAAELALAPALILICGRYEGIDERVCHGFVDDEVSVGDFVLTGGELPAMVVMEAVTRLIPGTLGGEDSARQETFTDNLLEHAHFTRPREFQGKRVPDVLFSGNHEAISRWRRESSMIRTFLKRMDLLENRALTSEEIRILEKWCLEIERIIKNQTLRGTGALSGGE